MPFLRSLSIRTAALFALALMLVPSRASAVPAGSGFTYQGKIDRGGSPGTGSYDFQFKLWDDLSAGAQVGVTQTVSGVALINGLFTVTIDFGAVAFNGDARWLEISVKGPGDAGFTLLTPRQAVTATPYAIRALTGGGGFSLPFAGSWSGSGNAFGVTNPNSSGTAVFDDGGLVGLEGSGSFAGVWGRSTTQYGVRGETTAGASGGVRGQNFGSGPGVEGVGGTGNGVMGTSGSGHGIYGTTFSSSTAGVFGTNSSGSGNGVHGQSTGGFGVYGSTGGNGGAGVFGQTSVNNASGVLGRNEASGPNAWAVLGYASSGALGVWGVSEQNDGVVGGTNGDGKSGVHGYATMATSFGGYFRNGGGGVALRADGLAQVQTLQILGGADLAEQFASEDQAEPGTVMAIDPDSPGQMRVADEPYCRRVAGVVSGANALKAGVVLSEDGVTEGTLPIALTGRVWVKADATRAPIRPGDLLTTSDRPGYAMKAADTGRASGAILGKAMTSLERGTGLVLTLVSLQ